MFLAQKYLERYDALNVSRASRGQDPLPETRIADHLGPEGRDRVERLRAAREAGDAQSNG